MWPLNGCPCRVSRHWPAICPRSERFEHGWPFPLPRCERWERHLEGGTAGPPVDPGRFPPWPFGFTDTFDHVSVHRIGGISRLPLGTRKSRKQPIVTTTSPSHLADPRLAAPGTQGIESLPGIPAASEARAEVVGDRCDRKAVKATPAIGRRLPPKVRYHLPTSTRSPASRPAPRGPRRSTVVSTGLRPRVMQAAPTGEQPCETRPVKAS